MGVTIDEILVGDEPDTWRGGRLRRRRRRHLPHRPGPRPTRGTRRRQAHPRLVVARRPCRPAGRRPARRHPDHRFGGRRRSSPAPTRTGRTYIDHVVLLTPDLARTIDALASIGVTREGERDSDTYGAPMRQVFFRLGEVILELIGQIDSAGEGAPGFFGLAVTVDDLDALGRLLGEHLGTAKDAVQEGRRIATLRHRELGMSVATAFMSPEPGSIAEEATA